MRSAILRACDDPRYSPAFAFIHINYAAHDLQATRHVHLYYHAALFYWPFQPSPGPRRGSPRSGRGAEPAQYVKQAKRTDSAVVETELEAFAGFRFQIRVTDDAARAAAGVGGPVGVKLQQRRGFKRRRPAAFDGDGIGGVIHQIGARAPVIAIGLMVVHPNAGGQRQRLDDAPFVFDKQGVLAGRR